MATTYPTTLDTFVNPATTDKTNSPSHAGQHDNINDAMAAVQTKLGADSSAVTSTIDYKLKNTSSSDPGHKHTVASLTSMVDLTTAQILTNKGITKRVLSAASYTTDTGTSLNCDNLDWFIVTAQAGALKLNNPTGAPTNGQLLAVAITGTASRALTYDTQFEASTVALPTTTVNTARLNILFTWRADTSKWVCLAAV